MARQIETIATYHARVRKSAQEASSINDCPFEFLHDLERWQVEYKRAQFDRAQVPA